MEKITDENEIRIFNLLDEIEKLEYSEKFIPHLREGRIPKDIQTYLWLYSGEYDFQDGMNAIIRASEKRKSGEFEYPKDLGVWEKHLQCIIRLLDAHWIR